jgi:hypothetical protein
MMGAPNGDAPSLLNASYNFKVNVEIPQGGAEGMPITQGGRFGGYGFYPLKRKPVLLWNLADLKRIRWEGPGTCARTRTSSSLISSATGSARARFRYPARLLAMTTVTSLRVHRQASSPPRAADQIL